MDEVERAAIAAYNTSMTSAYSVSGKYQPWEDINSSRQNYWRDIVKAVITVLKRGE